MKAAKNICNAFFKTVLLLLLIAFQSCSTYNSKTADIESDLFNGDFNQAIANIDQNKFLLKDRNRLLYLLEKGKVEHLNGNYENSNALLEEAYIIIEDRMTKTSAGQAISAKFTNPMAEPYKGEDFEKVTIHYYKALNYFQLGMPNEALVEAKRINIKLYELNEKYKENKNKYSEDVFSQILQGILYESTGDINNAFIAYRNAEEIYDRNGGQYFGVNTPEQLKKDLLRTSKQMGFMEDYENYRKKFNYPADTPPAPLKKSKGKSKKPAPQQEEPKEPEVTGEAIVFWENGLGPAKDQIVITASGTDGFFYGTYYDGATMEEIIIPIPVGFDIGSVNAIAIPKYRKRDSYYGQAAIVVNGTDQPLELAQDFYPIAKQCLKDRMLRETIDLVARFATKKAASAGLGALGSELFGDVGGELMKLGGDIAGAATEKADTRNWQTLPATISYTRVPLKEGENKFVIRKQGPLGIDTDTLYIPYKKGLQIVNYFDLGRTQIMPANNSGVNNMVASLSGNAEGMPGLVTTAVPNAKGLEGVSVESVIDKYVIASGGKETINAVQTIYTKYSYTTLIDEKPVASEMIMKMNAKKDFSMEIFTDGSLLSKTVVNNEGGFTSFNGKTSKMSKKDAENVRNSTGIYDGYIQPLKGSDVQLEGIVNINNENAYAISYTPAYNQGADIKQTSYYSVNTGLLIGTRMLTKIGKEAFESMTYYSDYRDVKGLKFSFKSVTKSMGQETTTEITEIKIDEGITDADFQQI